MGKRVDARQEQRTEEQCRKRLVRAEDDSTQVEAWSFHAQRILRSFGLTAVKARSLPDDACRIELWYVTRVLRPPRRALERGERLAQSVDRLEAHADLGYWPQQLKSMYWQGWNK